MDFQYSELQSLEEISECMKFFFFLQGISVLLHLGTVRLQPVAHRRFEVQGNLSESNHTLTWSL